MAVVVWQWLYGSGYMAVTHRIHRYFGRPLDLKMTFDRLPVVESYLFIVINQYLLVEAIGVRWDRSVPIVQCNESFYASPPQLFFTEIAGFVFKSAPGRMVVSPEIRCPSLAHPPRRHRSIGLCTQENVWILCFQLCRSLCRAATFVSWAAMNHDHDHEHETFVKENHWFGGGGYRSKNHSNRVSRVSIDIYWKFNRFAPS